MNTTLAFAEAQNNGIGTLTVSDGTHTANILLLGQYSAAQFHVTTDGNGGTLVTDPPVVSGTAASDPFAARASMDWASSGRA